MKKAIGYIRTAREDGEGVGQSLQSQEQAIRAYCASMGFELAHLIEDARASGSAALSDRSGGAELLHRLAENEAQHIVVSGLDRLTRDSYVFRQQIQEWDERGIRLHVVQDNGAGTVVSSASSLLFCVIVDELRRTCEACAAAQGRNPST
jgi:DNA invertase Pin-like site-specific DNA recombinase